MVDHKTDRTLTDKTRSKTHHSFISFTYICCKHLVLTLHNNGHDDQLDKYEIWYQWTKKINCGMGKAIFLSIKILNFIKNLVEHKPSKVIVSNAASDMKLFLLIKLFFSEFSLVCYIRRWIRSWLIHFYLFSNVLVVTAVIVKELLHNNKIQFSTTISKKFHVTNNSNQHTNW